MLSIQYEDVEEKVQIGHFFDSIDFNSDAEPTSPDGDSYTNCAWPVEVLSLDGYYPVEGVRWTPEDRVYRVSIKTDVGIRNIECADNHLILCQEPSQWTKAVDLVPGSKVVDRTGIGEVLSVTMLERTERLCDLQVAISHSYYTNDILSHNSHFLVQMGAEALRVGKNVVHYTFELTETAVGLRYDSNLCNMPSNDVIDRKGEVLDFYKNTQLGRLIIKEYPTGTPSVQTLRNHIEKLLLKSFVPSVIIIDYADIMKSSRKFDSLRHELKLVYEELRNMAMELKVPIWTASQANREASNSEIVGLENMSEAYGKAMVADVVLSISRKPNEKATGAGRIFVAKNRAGRDGMLFPMKIDTSMSKFTLLDSNEQSLNDVVKADGTSMKTLLKEKWKEING
jgi:hypothetical protein